MNKILFPFLSAFLFVACIDQNNRSVELNDSTSYQMDDRQTEVNAVSDLPFKMPKVPDTIYFADEVIPLTDLDLRERFDRELVVNNFWHSNTLFYFKRANRWFPVMKPILIENNIPEDFLYLAVIESGLIQAMSPSGALGFWQFMKGTALDYGLIVNTHIDERKHIEKSTIAACEYLKKAHEKFGSWSLAAAAYNRGKGGINSDLMSQNVSNFYDLHLNEETSRYVFRILAVKYIMENPKAFGFAILDAELYPPIKTEKVKIHESIPDLVEWAQENGVNYKILKKLNPWLLQKELIVPKSAVIFIELPAKGEHLSNFEVINE